MGGQRSTFWGPMVLDLGGQWSGANGLGGQSSIYRSDLFTMFRLNSDYQNSLKPFSAVNEYWPVIG